MDTLIMENDVAMRAADNIRILSAAMVEKAASGHPGGAMGGADFIQILFSEFLCYDPEDPEWFFRDRFFLDPGHMSPMLYATLALVGHYTVEDLKQFRQWGSVTPGHPEVDFGRGVENTSGPLGQGHTNAVGAAIAERFIAVRFGEWTAHKTFAYISDGGVQEEISQGAGRIAGFLGLGNLIMFYDANDIQLSSSTSDVTAEDTAKKYEAWGWHTVTIDGNDSNAIREAIRSSYNETERPSLIIGKTIMGKGAIDDEGKSYEKKHNTHGQPLTKAGASFDATIGNLGGDSQDPFKVFPEVANHYKQANADKTTLVKAKRNFQQKWEYENPIPADKLNQFISGEIQPLDFTALKQQRDIPTRNASANVLSFLADKLDNMIVASADLCDSDKTDAFLKKKGIFKPGDFSGAFLQAGVSELTMAAIANGMALHGGVIPVCATFFVFSDFMKPAIRLAALMELPVIYIWTHDSFRVGEDGPTHQPIEQEAQIRLLEKLKNHSGRNSLLALRPADAAETTVAWQLALDNRKTPTGLIFSRQVIASLPDFEGVDRTEHALMAEKGAYLVKQGGRIPDIVLIANGSEVATLLEASEEVEKALGIKINIVSVISEGLFREQPESYQLTIIPEGVPVFGLTAGLPVTLEGLVGIRGKVVGLSHFGYSAPAGVLNEKFGYTKTAVAKEITNYYHEINKS